MGYFSIGDFGMIDQYENEHPFLLEVHFAEAVVDRGRTRLNIYVPQYPDGLVSPKDIKDVNSPICECSELLSEQISRILNGEGTVLSSEICPLYYGVGGALPIDHHYNAILTEEKGLLSFPRAPLRKLEDITNPEMTMLRPALEDIIILHSGKAIIPQVDESQYFNLKNSEIESAVVNAVSRFASGGAGAQPYGLEYADASLNTDKRNTVAIVSERDGELKELGLGQAILNINSRNGMVGVYGALKYYGIDFRETLPESTSGRRALYIADLGELMESDERQKVHLIRVENGFRRKIQKSYRPSEELSSVLAFLKG